MESIKIKNLFNKNIKITIVDDVKEANFITHNGTFHADEVMALCIMSNVFSEIRLYRTTKLPEETNALVFDMGGGLFDHHGKNFDLKRSNGIKYASCGLIWQGFGERIIKLLLNEENKELFNSVDNDLIMDIDRYDNGQTLNINIPIKMSNLSMIVDQFNPTWERLEDEDKNFLKAVEFCNVVFLNEINNKLSLIKAKKIIEKKIEESKDGIIILDSYMPWKDIVLESNNEKAKDINYAIVPSKRGGFNIVATPLEKGSFEMRKPLPSILGGKSKEELQELTGVETLYFCHKNLFTCACETFEDALKIADIAVKNNEYEYVIKKK